MLCSVLRSFSVPKSGFLALSLIRESLDFGLIFLRFRSNFHFISAYLASSFNPPLPFQNRCPKKSCFSKNQPEQKPSSCLLDSQQRNQETKCHSLLFATAQSLWEAYHGPKRIFVLYLFAWYLILRFSTNSSFLRHQFKSFTL